MTFSRSDGFLSDDQTKLYPVPVRIIPLLESTFPGLARGPGRGLSPNLLQAVTLSSIFVTDKTGGRQFPGRFPSPSEGEHEARVVSRQNRGKLSWQRKTPRNRDLSDVGFQNEENCESIAGFLRRNEP